MEKRIWAVYIFHKFLSQIVFPAWFSATPAALYMRLHVQLAPGPRPLFPAPPPLPSCTLFPTKKKTLFSFGSHFRSFCVVHFTFHSVHSECVSHPLVRVLRGYFAKLLRHYFPCVSVCVFFFTPFSCSSKNIYMYIYFFSVWIMPFWHFSKLFRCLQAGGLWYMLCGCNVSALGWQCSGNISNGPRS